MLREIIDSNRLETEIDFHVQKNVILINGINRVLN